jgi:hypothetical protein
LATVGAGAAGLVLSGILYGTARHDYDAQNVNCPNDRCTTRTSYRQRNAAVDEFHWSVASAGVSTALLALGSAIWLSGKRPRTNVELSLGAKGGELIWQACF